jgi:hypothetical protein
VRRRSCLQFPHGRFIRCGVDGAPTSKVPAARGGQSTGCTLGNDA